MSPKRYRRALLPLAAAGIVGLALTGCTGDIAAGDKENTDCSAYDAYGTFEGSPEVSIGGTIQDAEADRLVESWKDFQTCTGITVNYQGTKEFESQISVLAEAGMSNANIAKLTIYLTDAANVPGFVEAAAGTLPATPPATTLLIVKALAAPELLVEVEAIAVDLTAQLEEYRQYKQSAGFLRESQ